jgi:hypothetical protein
LSSLFKKALHAIEVLFLFSCIFLWINFVTLNSIFQHPKILKSENLV